MAAPTPFTPIRGACHLAGHKNSNTETLASYHPVDCSPGKTLLGTGSTIEGGPDDVVIDEIKPNGGPGVAATQITVEAVEVDDCAGDWTVNALAICADPLDG